MDLAGVAEISASEIEILRHDAEGEIFVAENAAHLANHFFYADVGAGVARAVVSGEEKFEFGAGLPGLSGAEHPFELVEFDEAADPGFEEQVGHERGSCEAFAAREAAWTGASVGHSRYLKTK